MAIPQALVRLAKKEAYDAWKASDYARSELDEWCEENCAKYEVEAPKLRAWIVDAAANDLARAKLDGATDAQKTAHLVGATLPKALGTLVSGLSAERVKVLVDRNGKRVGEERAPDNEARISAAKEILKVLGAYAPEKVELFNGHLDEFTRLSDEELRRQISEARKRTGTGDAAGIDGSKSEEGLSVLAPERDLLERRTGRVESVQTFPGQTLLPADPGRTQ